MTEKMHKALSELFDKGYEVGYKKAKEDFARPHGEWIYVHPLQEDDGGAYMCSVCKTGDWDIRGNENFCPNCGSDNRKRGA